MPALERIDYHDGEVALTGWLARPVHPPRAAVLVFPTIANVTPHIEHRAERLAEADYLAFIADFYGEPVPDFASARPLADKLRADVGRYRARLLAALATVQELAASPGMPIAAIGFCMGGQAALELARSGADILAAVSFHGLLDTQAPAEPGVMKARLLICHGDADPMVPRDQVRAFQEEMDHVGGHWHLHSYGGVKHGFTDFGSDARGMAAIAYDASADRQSWAAMHQFFDEALA
jgi:dienelactone hydrolase